MSSEKLTPQEKRPSESAEAKVKRPASERKREANRRNSRRSTGPRTARGKRNSSFNALKHGMLARKHALSVDGKLVDEDLQRLFRSLRDEYGCGDVASHLLAEEAAIAYLRLWRGLEYESKYLTLSRSEFHPQGWMPTLTRYLVANQHIFEKTLQRLMDMAAQRKAAEEASEGDSESLGPTLQARGGTDTLSGLKANPPLLPAEVAEAGGGGEAQAPRPVEDGDRSQAREEAA